MAKFQVVEKDDFGTDWAAVRYNSAAMNRYDTEEEAVEAAKKYLTELNCNNALTKDEKQAASEAFMMLDDGCFLGTLDGEEWYLTYPKDILGKTADGSKGVVHEKGDKVTEDNYFELEGKAQVMVRTLPGT